MGTGGFEEEIQTPKREKECDNDFAGGTTDTDMPGGEG